MLSSRSATCEGVSGLAGGWLRDGSSAAASNSVPPAVSSPKENGRESSIAVLLDGRVTPPVSYPLDESRNEQVTFPRSRHDQKQPCECWQGCCPPAWDKQAIGAWFLRSRNKGL